MDFSFVYKMIKSIVNQDVYILIFGLITTVFLLLVINCNNEIKKSESKMIKNPDWAKKLRKKLNFRYSIFTTSITIFPLLGMMGTVAALLTLKFSGVDSDMSDIKNNFFNALTSTAWGIVFSITFKLFNAVIVSNVNDTISKIHSIVNNIENKDDVHHVAKDDDE